jgi:hypothetical protein
MTQTEAAEYWKISQSTISRLLTKDLTFLPLQTYKRLRKAFRGREADLDDCLWGPAIRWSLSRYVELLRDELKGLGKPLPQHLDRIARPQSAEAMPERGTFPAEGDGDPQADDPPRPQRGGQALLNWLDTHKPYSLPLQRLDSFIQMRLGRGPESKACAYLARHRIIAPLVSQYAAIGVHRSARQLHRREELLNYLELRVEAEVILSDRLPAILRLRQHYVSAYGKTEVD